MNLLLLQETVTLDAEFHEHGLKAGFDAGDHTFINAAVKNFPGRIFDVKFFQAAVFDNSEANLFRIHRIDENFAGHSLKDTIHVLG